MSKIEYIGNPQFSSEEEKRAWIAKQLGCQPEQLGCVDMSIKKLTEIIGLPEPVGEK
jgi:hypothetical protein